MTVAERILGRLPAKLVEAPAFAPGRGALPTAVASERPRRCRRPVEGQIYYNTTTHRLYCYDGSTWQGCW